MKEGDSVICINNNYKDIFGQRQKHYLTIGKIYTIRHLDEFEFCWVANDIGEVKAYMHRRFETVKENRKKKLLKLNEK